jgi:ATP-binding cassette subfamily B (MDR/TAP) protein 1
MFCNYALSFWYGAKLIYDQTNNPVVKRSYNVGDVMIIFFAI